MFSSAKWPLVEEANIPVARLHHDKIIPKDKLRSGGKEDTEHKT